jgi:hypothetical protein
MNDWCGEEKEEDKTGRGRSIYDIMDISGAQAVVFLFSFRLGFWVAAGYFGSAGFCGFWEK